MIVKLLLAYGARKNLRNKKHALAAECTVDPELSKIILSHGEADQNLDFFGGTPPHDDDQTTAQDQLFKVVRSGDIKQIRSCILDSAADPNAFNKSGQNALHLAAGLGFLEVTELLVRSGANPQTPSLLTHDTPLHLASKGDHVEVVTFLSRIPNIRIDLQDKLGNSPLHYSVGNGSLDTTSLLLKTGSRLDLVNVLGQTPLDVAVDQGREALILLLEQKKKKKQEMKK